MTTQVGEGRFEAHFEVRALGGELFWYFPGPDRRYNGGGALLHTSDMRAFMAALDESWEHCKNLRARAEDLSLEQTRSIGKWSFHIATQGWCSGVTPFSDEPFASRICVRKEDELEALKAVVQKALELFPRLASLAASD